LAAEAKFLLCQPCGERHLVAHPSWSLDTFALRGLDHRDVTVDAVDGYNFASDDESFAGLQRGDERFLDLAKAFVPPADDAHLEVIADGADVHVIVACGLSACNSELAVLDFDFAVGAEHFSAAAKIVDDGIEILA
jgi:hypothetical protein